ncbi:MAG: sensor domain-containing diguanylate cyclase [Synergistaceae bacterium]|jgi:diguanylate cyclase (GGDEF)-like protein/PAS domain S-box-containing protein|nr:sensor domain-containing diguanylate cyclase [Synergistaceae bacterium]
MMKKNLKTAGNVLKIGEAAGVSALRETSRSMEELMKYPIENADSREGLLLFDAKDGGGDIAMEGESAYSFELLKSQQERLECAEAELERAKKAHALAEEKLQEEKERWQLIMQCSQDGVWDIDLDTKTALYCSPRFIDLTGIEPDGVTFVYDWLKLFHPDDKEAMTFFFNVFSGKNIQESFQLDHRLFCRSGEYRWFMTRGVLLKNPLTQRFSRLVGISIDIQERKEREEIFSYRAMHDVLTDLPNRELFDDRLKSSIEFAKRNGSHLAVVMLDLDYFKQVNDTLGHQVGDALLVEVAARLRKSIRESDMVSRFGGDEFAMLLAFGEKEWHGLTKALNRIVSTLKKPVWFDEKKLKITSSMGICVAPDDGDHPKELLKRADDALYYVKSSGRSAYAFWKPDRKYVLVKS